MYPRVSDPIRVTIMMKKAEPAPELYLIALTHSTISPVFPQQTAVTANHRGNLQTTGAAAQEVIVVVYCGQYSPEVDSIKHHRRRTWYGSIGGARLTGPWSLLGFDNITFAAQYRISGVLKYFGRPPFGQPISDWKEEMPRTPSPYGRSKGKKKANQLYNTDYYYMYRGKIIPRGCFAVGKSWPSVKPKSQSQLYLSIP